MTFISAIKKPSRGFSRREFEGRLDRAQRLMQQQNMDVLLLTTEPEVRYFTGFMTQFWHSPTRPWFVLIPARAMPVAIVPIIGTELMRSTWIEDVRSWDSPKPQDEGVSLLKEAIVELSGSRSSIGMTRGDGSVVRMSLEDMDKLKRQLSGCQWLNCTPLIRELRMVKSEEEINKMAWIGHIASNVFESVPDFLAAGIALDQTFCDFKIEMLRQGADDIPYLVGGAGENGYSDVISPPSERPLEAGDIVMYDTGAVFDGYFCDFDRNFAIGHASDQAARAYQTLYKATEAGLIAARPGATCSQLYRSMQKVIENNGGTKGNIGRFGHGLGMQLTEWPSNMPDDHTIIEAGMVLTVEPSMEVTPGRYMVHEENFVVRANGIDLLNRRAPAELPIVDK